jgi:hypothetical protein
LVGLFPCDWDKHFKLVADVDLLAFDGKDGRSAFNVIGTDRQNPFTGVFDGNDQTISHLTIKRGDYVGLFGYLGSMAEVRNLGVVDVNIAGSGGFVGGLVGANSGNVMRCYSSGSVTGEGPVGGLVGSNWNGEVTQSHSISAVSGTDGVGGLVGENGRVMRAWGIIIESYSTGLVSGSGWSVGGLVGGNGGTVTACFWDTQTSGQATSDGGTGKTTAEMQTASTFLDAGWDFVGETANGTEDIWWILEGKDYPRLWWEAAGP